MTDKPTTQHMDTHHIINVQLIQWIQHFFNLMPDYYISVVRTVVTYLGDPKLKYQSRNGYHD